MVSQISEFRKQNSLVIYGNETTIALALDMVCHSLKQHK